MAALVLALLAAFVMMASSELSISSSLDYYSDLSSDQLQEILGKDRLFFLLFFEKMDGETEQKIGVF